MDYLSFALNKYLGGGGGGGGGTCICRDTGMCHYSGYFSGCSRIFGYLFGLFRIFGHHFFGEIFFSITQIFGFN